MATFSNPADAFYDNSTGPSPRGFRNPSMTRPMGRNDGFGTVQGSMFGHDNGIPSMRFDNARDGFGMGMPNVTTNNAHFPYDPSAAQTWSAGPGSLPPFGNGMATMGQNGNYGPKTVKPSRGRAGISNVSVLIADILLRAIQ